jgi:hypothetical protein
VTESGWGENKSKFHVPKIWWTAFKTQVALIFSIRKENISWTLAIIIHIQQSEM